MPGKVVLKSVGGPIQGQEYTFDEHDTFIFGRSEDCHARLPKEDPSASRHHFIVEVSPPDARLRDLGSLNGTFINGVKHGGRKKEQTPEEAARQKYPEIDLKHGDQIKVGKTVFSVQVEAPPPPTEEAPRCQQCGKDVSKEVGEGRHGEYVCDACREKAKEDPLALLMQMLLQAAQVPKDASPGTFPGYEIVKRLGVGGMGAVYLARRKKDGLMVALKVMLAKVAVDEASRKGFLREIEVTGGLRHPHIVELLDHGAAGSGFYFVMEFCPGGSVDGLLAKRGGKLPLGEAGPIMLQALEGLAYAHEKKIVHRDLKPQNLLISAEKDGVVKVSDFGLAKNFEKAGFSKMTATGAVAGTCPFMAREQVTNYKYVKPVTDVWSMGATMYALLTGTMPRDFNVGADPVEIILTCPPVPILKRDASIPARVAEVIDHALSDKVKDRFQTADEFRKALEAVL